LSPPPPFLPPSPCPPFFSASTRALASGPEQIHLAYTGIPGELSVDFVTQSSDGAGARWGLTNSSWTGFANATSFLYPAIGYMHQALMQFGEGSGSGEVFYYQVGSDAAGWSQAFAVTPSPARPEVFVVYGDFGLANDVSLDALIADASAGVFDSVLHVGDFAYDFQSNGSTTGNTFMNLIQPYASVKPVMPAVGNHEDCGECPGVPEVPYSYSNFSQYKVRFHSVSLYAGANSGSSNNLFYSFRQGLTHFLVFSAEAYIYARNATFIANQLAFMKADLASVNRTQTPWVVGLAHKNWRMSEEAFADFAPILQDGGVDFLFCGHYHYYARTLPYNSATNQTDTNATNADYSVYTNPSYMTIVVTGASGDREKESACEGHDSAPVVQCSRNYGYGFFTAVNHTHATWTFKSVSPYGHGPKNFTDSLTVIHTDR
jgi:hypothetical protein